MKSAAAGTAARSPMDRGEAALVAGARAGDETAIRALIKANNQLLFRVARAVLRNDGEAEDVVQETYMRAFTRLASFRGEAAFSTWLTRIALNAALSRRRRRRNTVDIDMIDIEMGRPGAELIAFPGTTLPANPEHEAGRRQMRALLEAAVDALPEPFRVVFVLREIEEMDIAETAAFLAIKPETVKTRLFRARRLIRAELEQKLSPVFAEVFPFDGARCARLADRVVVGLAT
jgi:RNA polymerase sigma-70 factor (ECF subfamily)